MPSSTVAASDQALLPVGAVCEVFDPKTGSSFSATVLSRRCGSPSHPSPGYDTDNVQYYIHRHDQDKRMDGWVDHASIRPASDTKAIASAHSSVFDSHSVPSNNASGSRPHPIGTPQSVDKGKRKAEHDPVQEGSDGSRTPSASRQASPALPDRATTQRGRYHTSASSSDTPALRNIDRVLYGNFDIKTWYYSPYPLDHDDDGVDNLAAYLIPSHVSASSAASRRHQSPSTSRLGAGSPAATKRAAARKDSASSLGGALSTSAREAPAIKALATNGSEPNTSSSRNSPASASLGHVRSRKDAIPTKMLWICDGCFKYMKTYNGFAAHRKFCRNTHPPGRKVYQRGAHIIWQVDGAQEKLYCQNLSLFGKLFIDHKTIYFDVEPFVFYVLTDAATASFDHPLGFFSKEKISYDDYNLACIVTFPPFQRKSFGTLMIEFSYYLSAAQGMLGTPERPLSDLGLKGYLSFWTAVLLRELSACFDGPLRPAESSATRQRRTSSAVRPTETAAETSTATPAGTKLKAKAETQWQILVQRCKLLNIPIESISHQAGFTELQQLAAQTESFDSLTASGSVPGSSAVGKRKLRNKGWAGSTPARQSRQLHGNQSPTATDTEGTARRSSRVAVNGVDKREDIHPALNIANLQQDAACTMAVTVDDLSNLTHLRTDDIVLALSEAGLVDAPHTPYLPVTDEAVTQHITHPNGSVKDSTHRSKEETEQGSLALLLTRDAIRQAIARFNIRPAVLDESYALI